MPNQYGTNSEEKLNQCHPDLQKVFRAVLKKFDHSILEGHRGRIRQNELYENGKSKVKYPNGKHNKIPSEAVDAVPYPIDWSNRERMTLFAGWVLGVAQAMGIAIRWGGDWDQDTEVIDNNFDDLVHFELVR
ncbi:M15 family peptidase [candidate division KSB1 bacterium]